MSNQTMLAVLAMVLSIMSVVVSGLFSIRTAKISHDLDDERERRQEELSAIKAAERVYEPLAQAAAELQSRIFNIVETGWVSLVKRYESHGDYAVTSTAFLFAHYFGWIEARRQAVLSSSGEGRRDESVQERIDGVLQTLRRSENSEGFLFFNAEQRAIGELMFSWEVVSDLGLRIPRVAGYAAFAKRFREEPEFRQWFGPVDTGMDLVSKGDDGRLIEIHQALVELIVELDPKHKYTAGYELRAIDHD